MSIEGVSLARQIGESIGAEHVLDDPAACAAFAVQGCVPALVARPGSVEELAQTMAAAHAAAAAVVPWGGGSRQSMGRPPQRLDVVLRTDRLAAIIEHEPGDLTIAAQAGMTMAALQAALAPHGQMLPVDVALPARSTIGGALASAADGPRRLGYGTFRDLLIGVQVVEATGRISKAGGMVVKNVSGFDMMKLYLGSLGTLAIIVSANFKLLPRPRAAATILCAFATRAAAFELAEALHSSQLVPVAAEYLAGYRLEGGAAGWAVRQDQQAPHYLAVWAEGLPAAVARQCRDVAALAQQAGSQSVEQIEGEAHAALWAALADVPQLVERPPEAMLLRLPCLPSELGRALADASDTARRHGLGIAVCARALSGMAYLRVAGAQGLVAFQRELLSRWPQLAVLGCEPELAAQLAVWGAAQPGQALMQRIKQEFDPQDSLNPGRFVIV